MSCGGNGRQALANEPEAVAEETPLTEEPEAAAEEAAGVVEGVVVDAPAVADEPAPPAPPAKAESTLKGDIIAGLSVACVAIPQSCGYAMLAGTGVKCAIMAAAASALPAALLISSRYMHVGCISLASLLTGGRA